MVDRKKISKALRREAIKEGKRRAKPGGEDAVLASAILHILADRVAEGLLDDEREEEPDD